MAGEIEENQKSKSPRKSLFSDSLCYYIYTWANMKIHEENDCKRFGTIYYSRIENKNCT